MAAANVQAGKLTRIRTASGSGSKIGRLVVAVSASLPVLLAAETDETGRLEQAAREERRAELPGMTVIGSPQAVFELPGSGAFLGLEEIRTQNYDDIHRLLRQVPGVYVREEDGYGLFPNISLRGVDVGRTSKVTVMEDGVLAAPAPYSAPAAYYSPTTGRMDGIEILKGSSQVRFGPHTTGGVINYISTPIPDGSQGFARASYGSDHDLRLHLNYGQTMDTVHGRLGYLFEGFYRQADGFKKISGAGAYPGDDDTGFRKTEPMLKLTFEPRGDLYQRFEFKLGYTDMDADETYVGLSEADFARDPYRRYPASRFDNIATEQWRMYLRHYIEPTPTFNLTSTVYYNRFNRNWFKAHQLRGAYTYDDGTPINNPSISGALAGGGTALGALRGENAGTIRYRHNNRSYASMGAESVAEFSFDTGNAGHRLSLGLLYHEDYVRRFQKNEDFVQDADGNFVNRIAYAPGSQDNRRETTKAMAVFVENQIAVGDWTFTPGIRYEHLWQKARNYNQGTSGKARLDMVAGGLGVTYEVSPLWTAFGGLYAGFSPPEPGRRVNEGIKEETSLGTELGLRYRNAEQTFTAGAAYFHTRFDNLLVRDYVGAGGGSDNVGRATTEGIEFEARYDLGAAQGWTFSNPWTLAGTWTRARLGSDTTSDNPESIFSGGRKGNRIPYVPEWALSLGTGLEFSRLGLFVTGSYVDATFTTASNTTRQENVAGEPDSRFGKTDSVAIVDVSAHYWLTETAKLFGGVQNAFDREYVVARHPHGPRPGAPLYGYVGLELNW